MKCLHTLVFLLIPLLAVTQDSGISFTNQYTWSQIQDKANKENKYIFVDCFATWCVPCKNMEKTVFIIDSVGRYVNDRFIAVRLQMDTTKNDGPYVRSMFNTARSFSTQFNIQRFPTYLFFSPEGTIVHKAVGAWDAKDFINISRAALDTNQQYYSLLRRFRQANGEYSFMPILARMAKQMNEDSISRAVAEFYIDHFLDKLSEEQLCNKDHFDFAAEFQDYLKRKDRILLICLNQGPIVDSVMAIKGFSNGIVNRVAYNEILAKFNDPGMKGREPYWQNIANLIEKEYGSSFVQQNMNRAKIAYYQKMGQWKKYIECVAENMRTTDISKIPPNGWNMMILNNQAFEVFKYSECKGDLEMAVKWTDRALTFDSVASPRIAGIIDTKANLLYKLGEKKKGISLEEKATELAPQEGEFKLTLEKMKKGLPTWPLN